MEQLASVLDGSASPSERDDVMRRLAASREDYTIFLEAVAIARALESSEDVSFVMPRVNAPTAIADTALAPRRRRSRRYAAPLSLLAAALAIFFVSRLRSSGSADVLRTAYAVHVTGTSGAGALERRLGTEWNAPLWSVSRGSSVGVNSASRAFRAGVAIAQLQIALSVADSTAVFEIGDTVQELLAGVDGSAPLAARLASSRGRDGVLDARLLGEFAVQLRAVLGDGDWFDLGVWSGAARMAAQNEERAFFAANSAPMASLRGVLGRSVEPSDRWRAASQTLRALSMRNDGEPDLTAIRSALAAVAVAAGS